MRRSSVGSQGLATIQINDIPESDPAAKPGQGDKSVARTGDNRLDCVRDGVRRDLRRRLGAAASRVEWSTLAEEYDRLTGADAWRSVETTSLYDHAEIRRRYDRLARALAEDDHREILFQLNEGIHGNMGGMGEAKLYTRSLAQTKRLIGDYVGLLVEGLDRIAAVDDAVIGEIEKIDFLRRADHCYGHSALVLGGGAGLIYFHHGVVGELFDHGLLPNVISGSSAGGWMSVQLGALDDEELAAGVFEERRYREPKHETLGELLEDIRSGRVNEFREHVIDGFCPTMTFQEAYEHTGRYVNVSVAAAETHQTSRLLNAITSPSVTLRSAAMATSAVPGIVDPVQLEAKDRSGRIKPYLPGRKWVDGAVAEDLPARRLGRLYGVNHYIVSVINPATLPFVQPPELSRGGVRRAVEVARHALVRESIRLAGRVGHATGYGRVGDLLEGVHAMVEQRYTGDVTMRLGRHDYTWANTLFRYEDDDEIKRLILAGRRSVWPQVDRIGNSTRMSRKLDELLLRFDPPASHDRIHHVR